MPLTLAILTMMAAPTGAAGLEWAGLSPWWNLPFTLLLALSHHERGQVGPWSP